MPFNIYLFLSFLCFFISPTNVEAHSSYDQLAKRSLSEVLKTKGLALTSTWLEVRVKDQKLLLHKNGKVIKDYPISSAEFGIGNRSGSKQTPLGLHKIKKRVGDKAPLFTIFKGLGNIGKQWKKSNDPNPPRLVLTRALVLEGLEEGINKGSDKDGNIVDSLKRYIYIHGTTREDRIGTPDSEGCITMKNADILVLFDLVDQGQFVWIH